MQFGWPIFFPRYVLFDARWAENPDRDAFWPLNGYEFYTIEREIVFWSLSDRSMGPLNNIPWHQTSFHPVQHRNRWLMISCFVYFWLLGTCEDGNKQQVFPVLTKFVAPGTPAFSNWVNLRVLHTSSVPTTILSPLFTGLWSMILHSTGRREGSYVLILVLLD